MKKFALFFLLHFTSVFCFAQFTWTWMQGDALTPGAVNYGKKGISDAASYPGARIGQRTWIDKYNDTWVFGGLGFNDIWKFSVASQKWTWVNGSKFSTDPPVYGKKGVSSATNRIGTHNYAATWTDKNGDLWIFGGQRDPFCISAAVLVEATNDLWKYTLATNQWTWMGGDTSDVYRPVIIYYGIYTKKGVPAAINKPPSKHHAMNWIDREGNLWLFGGSQAGSVNNNSLNNTSALMNDLWRYAPSTGLWTWISGDSTGYSLPNANAYSNYGLKGVESPTNTPGNRTAGTTWTDSSGNFWLLGGYGNARSTSSLPGTGNGSSQQGSLNDLWKFSTLSNQWTWMGGDTIINAPGKYTPLQARPGGRTEGTGWTDKQGDLWLRSGARSSTTSYNDFWKYTVSKNEWTWMGGDSMLREYHPVAVQKNVFLLGVSPAPDPATVIEKDDSTLLFSLKGDQRWVYNKITGQWAFLTGQIVPEYTSTEINNGTAGIVDSAGRPKTRSYASTWRDKANNLWLFGGQAALNSQANLYDLWMYNIGQKTWTLKRGGEGIAPTNYGVAGQPSDSARPTQRSGAYTFVDQSGLLWLFGGVVSSYYDLTNDLWSYNPVTNQWTWYGGGGGVYPGSAVYQATPSQPAWPGAMGKGNAWVDATGNFWIFGGQSYNNINNEVWMFNTGTKIWTFIGGDKVSNVPPIYPPVLTGRSGATSWTDAAGNFWLFGGASYNARYCCDYGESRESFNNDLLKYSPLTKVWTRINGNGTINSRGRYGVKASPSVNSAPRARKDAVGWTDGDGNLYLFGGSRDTIKPCTFSTTEQFNDLWKYSIATNQWTWLAGDSVGNPLGSYGAYGVPSTENEPGGRSTSASWQDGTGNAWIFSGYGYAQSGKRALNDLMMFSTGTASTLPVKLTSFTATRQDASVSLQWVTAQEQNSGFFIVEHAADGVAFSAIGKVAASGNTVSPTTYSFRDINPTEGSNYYRLKEIDLDNNGTYSKIAKVDFVSQKSQVIILSNPVKDNLIVHLNLASSEMVMLQIADANGKMISSQNYPALRGSNKIDLNVSRLSAGNYILNIKSRSISYGKKFIKL